MIKTKIKINACLNHPELTINKIDVKLIKNNAGKIKNSQKVELKNFALISNLNEIKKNMNNTGAKI